MNLSTKYLGLQLKNPLIVSSSKLTGNYADIEKCVKSGAGAIVLKSIFEEQIQHEVESIIRKNADDSYLWFPEAKKYVEKLSSDQSLDTYLKFVTTLKQEFDIPVISSINCVSPNSWPVFAKSIQNAGADALELNISIFPFDRKLNSSSIEEKYVQIVREVKKHVSIPVSVKLGFYFTNIYGICKSLVDEGADGLILFNRFSRRDIDITNYEVIPDSFISSPVEMSLPLRWIALLSGNKIGCDLSASTGVHDSKAVIKQILAGANTVQLCSTLYINGINYIETILDELTGWMRSNNIDDLNSIRNKVSEKTVTDHSFEHLQFMKLNFE